MERFLFLEAAAHEPVALPIGGAEVWVHSTPGPHRSTPNEDAAGVWDLGDDGLVLAVADGLGGAASGGRAAACAIEALDRACTAAAGEGTLRAAILDAFERANAEILALGVGAGTTLIVVEIRDRKARTYHVGDSEALVVGQRGRVKLATMSHSPVGYGVAAGLIDPEAALDRADRHFIANHVGTADMHIAVGSALTLATRDTVLAASDGVLDNLTPPEIVETIRKGPLGEGARSLARRCAERMTDASGSVPSKPDDCSFILYREAR